MSEVSFLCVFFYQKVEKWSRKTEKPIKVELAQFQLFHKKLSFRIFHNFNHNLCNQSIKANKRV